MVSTVFYRIGTGLSSPVTLGGQVDKSLNVCHGFSILTVFPGISDFRCDSCATGGTLARLLAPVRLLLYSPILRGSKIRQQAAKLCESNDLARAVFYRGNLIRHHHDPAITATDHYEMSTSLAV